MVDGWEWLIVDGSWLMVGWLVVDCWLLVVKWFMGIRLTINN